MSQADEAMVAALRPAPLEVEQGKEYYWCGCGRSGSQPLCDGSHQSTTLTPKPLTAEESKTVYLCRCKQTKNPPFCDGSHSKLDDDSVGKTLPLPVST